MFLTRPPALSARPEGVSSGYDGAGGFIGPTGDCGVGPRDGELLRENDRVCACAPREAGESGDMGAMKRGEMLWMPCGMTTGGPCMPCACPCAAKGRGLPQPMHAMLRLNISGKRCESVRGVRGIYKRGERSREEWRKGERESRNEKGRRGW